MLWIFAFLVFFVAAENNVTLYYNGTLDSVPFGYKSGKLAPESVLIFNFTIVDKEDFYCQGSIDIEAAHIVQEDVITFQRAAPNISFSSLNSRHFEQSSGTLFTGKSAPPPYICAIIEVSKESPGLVITLDAKRICEEIEKTPGPTTPETKSSSNLSIFGLISCILLCILMK